MEWWWSLRLWLYLFRLSSVRASPRWAERVKGLRLDGGACVSLKRGFSCRTGFASTCWAVICQGFASMGCYHCRRSGVGWRMCFGGWWVSGFASMVGREPETGGVVGGCLASYGGRCVSLKRGFSGRTGFGSTCSAVICQGFASMGGAGQVVSGPRWWGRCEPETGLFLVEWLWASTWSGCHL